MQSYCIKKGGGLYPDITSGGYMLAFTVRLIIEGYDDEYK